MIVQIILQILHVHVCLISSALTKSFQQNNSADYKLQIVKVSHGNLKFPKDKKLSNLVSFHAESGIFERFFESFCFQFSPKCNLVKVRTLLVLINVP